MEEQAIYLETLMEGLSLQGHFEDLPRLSYAWRLGEFSWASRNVMKLVTLMCALKRTRRCYNRLSLTKKKTMEACKYAEGYRLLS